MLQILHIVYIVSCCFSRVLIVKADVNQYIEIEKYICCASIVTSTIRQPIKAERMVVLHYFTWKNTTAREKFK